MTARLLQYSDVENAYDDPERIARLAGLIDARRDGATAVVGTGDDFAPGVLSLVTEGRQSLDFYRAVRPDVETFGNHDFDYGPEAARAIVADSPQTWVTANVRQDDAPFAAAEGVTATTVRRVGDAEVGFFGLTAPETAASNPGADGLTFADPLPAARAAVADLHEQGVDHVVALSHLGDGDAELARAVDVDCVLGGHLHEKTVDEVAGTPVVRPGVNGHRLVEVDLDTGAVELHAVADGPVHDGVRAAMRAHHRAADLSEVVTTVSEPVRRDEPTVFGGEARVGNFVADAFRHAGVERPVDLALQNSGGIRSGPPLSGAVTVADLVSLVPFEERVVAVEVEGARLRAALASAADSVSFGAEGWWHAHLSGASVRYDRQAGLTSATVGGESLAEDRTYTLATSEFVLGASDEFPALDETLSVVERGAVQYEALVEHARENGVRAPIGGRVVLD
jgi:2',3'-cyclic-nucleotide 2'-phosphodiesterase (5'-nucleotidase family)